MAGVNSTISVKSNPVKRVSLQEKAEGRHAESATERGLLMPDCEYQCEFHRGKIEWHHPITDNFVVGIYLCEAHHSIIQGRKKRYDGEMMVNKSLKEMREELKALESSRVITGGHSNDEVDKH